MAPTSPTRIVDFRTTNTALATVWVLEGAIRWHANINVFKIYSHSGSPHTQHRILRSSVFGIWSRWYPKGDEERSPGSRHWHCPPRRRERHWWLEQRWQTTWERWKFDKLMKTDKTRRFNISYIPLQIGFYWSRHSAYWISTTVQQTSDMPNFRWSSW